MNGKILFSLFAALFIGAAPIPTYAQYTYGFSHKIKPNQDQPSVGGIYTDIDFGGEILRLTDAVAQGVVPKGNREGITNIYSRVQVENASGEKILLLQSDLKNHEIYKGFLVANLDGSDLQQLILPKDLPIALNITHLTEETQARWHPVKPNHILFIEGQSGKFGGLQLYDLDIVNNTVTIAADLTDKLPERWGAATYPNGLTRLQGTSMYEGGFSKNGDRFAWIIEEVIWKEDPEDGEASVDTDSTKILGYIAYDMSGEGVLLGAIDNPDDSNPADHIAIAPNGDYVVVSYNKNPSSYPVDFSSQYILGATTAHSDLCINQLGNSCYLYVETDDKDSDDSGWLVSVDLVTKKRTQIIDFFTRLL